MIGEPWTETLTFGPSESRAMLLAHAIILGIAATRYGVLPWWRRWRSARESAEDAPSGT